MSQIARSPASVNSEGVALHVSKIYNLHKDAKEL